MRYKAQQQSNNNWSLKKDQTGQSMYHEATKYNIVTRFYVAPYETVHVLTVLQQYTLR